MQVKGKVPTAGVRADVIQPLEFSDVYICRIRRRLSHYIYKSELELEGMRSKTSLVVKGEMVVRHGVELAIDLIHSGNVMVTYWAYRNSNCDEFEIKVKA